ncbi:uncharacterized protein I303_101235 [Kwoniella dejecticola CBS 10117]|uniref:SH3 domain-containing protein n=1 Tax=Kwoniella dejecticola CBS 10117 TaxID=1296121 RepID=A0A1A6AH58_9TREE|nr:uncharacterized protein I303_01242 [Kwoniella dejecticola CBS 10117]OBR89415.1 hypothetical protein I303_01242 [Kwoniella dejecticola CBS 10117]
MVFANLTYEAFFSLLDEYFESRPQFAQSQSSGPSISTLTRLIPPSRNANPPAPSASTASPSRSPVSPTASTAPPAGGEQQDMAQKFISSSIKMGTKGTKYGIGAISKNKDAMDLLGKAGAAGIVRGADKRLNSPPPVDGGATIEEVTVVEEKRKPGPPAKKGGVAGLVSGRSFGHVDTSSKMSAFTSMWKDPQKVKEPTVEHHMAPQLSNKHTSMPPPIRRDGSGHSARSSQPPEETVAQAQALYDYAGSDTTDLAVQANQIVNLIEKTSADWWTCEDGNGTRGLVPATYLKEL